MTTDFDEEVLAALPDARPGEALRMGFAKYAMFEGRAGRSEYWWWLLITAAVALVLAALSGGALALGATTTDVDAEGRAILATLLPLGLLVVWCAATLVPTLSVTTRRLRDSGVPAALTLLVAVPAGPLALLALCARPSDEDRSRIR